MASPTTKLISSPATRSKVLLRRHPLHVGEQLVGGVDQDEQLVQVELEAAEGGLRCGGLVALLAPVGADAAPARAVGAARSRRCAGRPSSCRRRCRSRSCRAGWCGRRRAEQPCRRTRCGTRKPPSEPKASPMPEAALAMRARRSSGRLPGWQASLTARANSPRFLKPARASSGEEAAMGCQPLAREALRLLKARSRESSSTRVKAGSQSASAGVARAGSSVEVARFMVLSQGLGRWRRFVTGTKRLVQGAEQPGLLKKETFNRGFGFVPAEHRHRGQGCFQGNGESTEASRGQVRRSSSSLCSSHVIKMSPS